MEKEEILEFIKLFGTPEDQKYYLAHMCDVNTVNSDPKDLPNGRHELGEGRWMEDGSHININERVDSTTILVKDNPKVAAATLHHYHRHRDARYGFAVYIKQG